MDQKTRQLHNMLETPGMYLVASILHDVKWKIADEKTIEMAGIIEQAFPEIWRNNQIVRIIGGTNATALKDPDWKDWLATELQNELENG